MTEVVVATWNLHHGVDHRPERMAGTWGFVRDRIAPTVALIQEADGVPDTGGGAVISPSGHPRRRFETAVVGYTAHVERVVEATSRYAKPPRAVPIGPTTPLTHAAALVTPSHAEPFVAVSLYGIIDIYSQASVLRAIADLMPLLDDPVLGRCVVIGGDLNAYDNGPSTDAASRGRWRAVFELFRSLGLVNLLERRRRTLQIANLPPVARCRCGLGDACFHVETWRSPRGSLGFWCLDYLFVTRELERHLVGEVEVWGETHPEVWGLSDHCPLVARFDLPAAAG